MEGQPSSNEETPKGLTKHAKEMLSEGRHSLSTRIKRRSAQLQTKFAVNTPETHPSPSRSSNVGNWEMEGLKVPTLLIQGTPMTKYSEKKGSKARTFRLDPDQGQILWPSRKSGIISIENIKELRAGSHARQLIQHFHLPLDFESRWLTIIYSVEGDYKTLHIVAPTTVIFRLWHVTLLQLKKVRLDFMMGLSSAERAQTIWERHHWKGADTSGDGQLDLSEVKGLCRRLNLSGGDSEVKKRFTEADTGGKGFLNYEEFRAFVRRLKERPEVEKVYLEVKGQGEFDFACFQRFMKDTQRTSRSSEEIEQMYRRFAIPSAPASVTPPEHSSEQSPGQLLSPGSTAPLLALTAQRPITQTSSDTTPATQLPPLSLAGFTAFLTSSHNSVFSDHHKDVSQDMTLPISNYFISSSHNTYLVGHQLVGDSTMEGYIRSLLASCRSVEMDIYDGDDGEPMITHGGTLTSKTAVKDVATAIAKYAFVSSPYPVIISAEIHCSIPQQKRVAEIFAHTFGATLVVAPVDEAHKEGDEVKCLPSPDQLKGRILLKAKNKYIDAARPKIQKLPDEEPSSDESARVVEKERSGLRGKFDKLFKWSHSKDRASPDSKRPNTPPVPVTPTSPLRLSYASLPAPTQLEGQPPKILMAPELLPLLVYTTGVSFRGLGHTQTYPLTHVFSLSEPRADSLVYSGVDALRLVNHTREHLVRVYPKGTRVDSSNYAPHKFWAAGCQLVTVNWQTVDLGFSMVQAFYARNGRAGFILKPEPLRIADHPALSYRPIKHILVVRVISAQQLPRPKDSQGREIIDRDTVDPYVRIDIHSPTWPTSATTSAPVGNNVDRGLKAKTSVIRNNGFNPRWEETLELEFDVLGGMTEFVFVRFVIKDHDVDRDNLIGRYCACLKTMELGYRHLALYDEQYGQYLFSTLFVHLSIKDDKRA